MGQLAWRIIAAVLLIISAELATAARSYAQSDPYVPLVDWHERLKISERLQPLGDDLMGDRIDPHTGALSFVHTDISIPGDSGLEVALRRRLEQGRIFGGYGGPHFADWSLAAPRISVVTADIRPWTGNRCTDTFTSQFNSVVMSGPTVIRSWEYSNGVTLEVGGSSEPLLESPGNAPWPSGTTHVTNSNWRFTCIGTDAFLGRAPDGTTYRFDRHIVRDGYPLKMSNGFYLDRDTHIMAATEVTDAHGNWVRYTYDTDGRLTRIHANDGREITLSYNGISRNVASATANGRTWTYTYRNGTTNDGIWAPITHDGGIEVLGEVGLPDGRRWLFQLDGMAFTTPPSRYCTGGAQMSVTHPTGAIGEFDTFVTPHRASSHNMIQQQAPGFCPSPVLQLPPEPPNSTTPLVSVTSVPVFSVTRKAIITPGGPTATWTFEYEQDIDSGTSLSDPTNWTTITGPDGHRTAYHVWAQEIEGGALVREEVRAVAGGPVLELTEYEYIAEGWYGRPGPELGVPIGISRQPRRLVRTTTTRDAVTYTRESDFITDELDPDYSWGSPVETRAFSSLAGASTRTMQIDYLHDTGIWMLSLPERITRNGLVFEQIGYTAAGQPATIDHFGARVETRSYNSDGTLAWIRDGLNRQTSFAGWRRGHPRTITRADGSQFTLQVDDDGRITQITNPRGASTGYGYTASGWLSLIDRPPGYSDTSIAYDLSGPGVVQTIDFGALRTVVEYDALLRPVREERRAISNGGGSIFTRFEYDGLGRTIFASLPSASSNPVDGVETSYDALGRVVRTEENVAPYAATVTEYLGDNRVRVTDPAGNVTTTWRSGYGGPDDGQTIRIDHPLGLTTEMTHDAWGNLLTARQYGSHSGFTVDETQVWAYDARLRLCRHATPQEGHTLYEYDAASQLIGVARGAPAGTGCNSLPAALTVDTDYDVLGRPDLIRFPDSPNINLDHDANGNLIQAARGSAVWTYAYDAMDRVLWENLAIDGRTYLTSHVYGADGRYAERVTPEGRVISFAPDGHGRPRRARVDGTDYASNALYHPSGQLAAADYGNGLDYLATFDARHQMTSQRVSAGASDRSRYSYGRDVLGRVTSLTDHLRSSQNRTYGYDALGRLVTATGEWGSGSYTYDLLNNIREKALGLRTVELQYDGSGRLDRYRDTDAGFTWRDQLYDGRGNVTSDGVHGFSYDASGQPYAISGGATGSFIYDPHRRRVKQTLNGETIYTIYGLDGTLYFRDNATTGETTDYIRMGSHTVGRMDQTGAFTWTHDDHLGSASAATNSAGNIVWRESYLPFGEAIEDPAANRDEAGFTGHIRDHATGLTYAQARYLNPVTGRFYAPDPVGFADMGPGYFNRYAYTMNDPVNLVDPDGEQPIPGWAYQQQLARDRAMRSGNPGELDRVVAQQARDNAVAAGVVIAVFTPGPDELLLAGIAAKTVRSARELDEGVGLVYRRTNNSTDRCYIGRCNSRELFDRRQRDHARANPDADYTYDVIDEAPHGLPLRQAEQRAIDAHGGPTNRSNPQGGTENRRNEIAQPSTGTRLRPRSN